MLAVLLCCGAHRFAEQPIHVCAVVFVMPRAWSGKHIRSLCVFIGHVFICRRSSYTHVKAERRDVVSR